MHHLYSDFLIHPDFIIQVDVAGMMYFWDLTIETVSFVVLIIAIGLSVDYASHVGHTFMIKSGTRKGDKICLAIEMFT